MTNRVKELRISKGISQRKLAEVLTKEYNAPTSFGGISRLELQIEDNPKWKSISAMATYFCVTTDYLMGKTDINLYFKQMKSEEEKKEDTIPQELLDKAVDSFVQQLKEEYNKNGEFTNLIKKNG
jgi:transcriptional regulator with XRE-family HTH domain